MQFYDIAAVGRECQCKSHDGVNIQEGRNLLYYIAVSILSQGLVGPVQ